ncbi:MAG: DUF4040 domain-containing protein [Calditrichaeota bacterium]|nr:DUF4040 domain-containing protein [Calditrichota bacterium]
MATALLVVLTVVIIGAAILTVYFRDLVAAIVASSVISLIASVYFYLLQAPDVAMTEAAVGVGLTTVIFIITVRKTKRYEE